MRMRSGKCPLIYVKNHSLMNLSKEIPENVPHEREEPKMKAERLHGKSTSSHITKETKVPLKQRLTEVPDTGLVISCCLVASYSARRAKQSVIFSRALCKIM